MTLKNGPDCLQQFRFLTLEILVQSDDRPVRVILRFQSHLYGRLYVIEKIFVKVRLDTSELAAFGKDRVLRSMSNNHPSGFGTCRWIPIEILLNGDWKTCG
jgi:hypothetical protein